LDSLVAAQIVTAMICGLLQKRRGVEGPEWMIYMMLAANSGKALAQNALNKQIRK
jgi:hypothetical protein